MPTCSSRTSAHGSPKERWFDWKTHWHDQGVKLRPYLDAGKQVQALSYLGHTPYGVKEDAFFCYATARLAGFVWNGGVAAVESRRGAAVTASAWASRWATRRKRTACTGGPSRPGWWRSTPTGQKDGFIAVQPPNPDYAVLTTISATGAEHWARLRRRADTADTAEKHSGSRGRPLSQRRRQRRERVEPDRRIEPGASRFRSWPAAGARPRASPETRTATTRSTSTSPTATAPRFTARSHPSPAARHDWEQSSVTVKPAKPIKSLTYNVLFRYKSGTVWFDDVSLKVLDDPQSPREVIQNGGLGASQQPGADRRRRRDKASSPCRPTPAASSSTPRRPPTSWPSAGPRLTVATEPGLGEVRFRVDGFDYWTHCGSLDHRVHARARTSARSSITFDKPGKHVVEVVDVVPADMKTPAGYGAGRAAGPVHGPIEPDQAKRGKEIPVPRLVRPGGFHGSPDRNRSQTRRRPDGRVRCAVQQIACAGKRRREALPRIASTVAPTA